MPAEVILGATKDDWRTAFATAVALWRDRGYSNVDITLLIEGYLTCRYGVAKGVEQ